MYSEGIVQSASNSNSQYPCACCVATSVSRAAAMLRSSSEESLTLARLCDNNSARAALAFEEPGVVRVREILTSRSSGLSGDVRVPAEYPLPAEHASRD